MGITCMAFKARTGKMVTIDLGLLASCDDTRKLRRSLRSDPEQQIIPSQTIEAVSKIRRKFDIRIIAAEPMGHLDAVRFLNANKIGFDDLRFMERKLLESGAHGNPECKFHITGSILQASAVSKEGRASILIAAEQMASPDGNIVVVQDWRRVLMALEAKPPAQAVEQSPAVQTSAA